MITITPQGSVYLCKTPLENDYQHQLTFANATAQLNYFNSKISYTCNDVTYIKKDNQIVVDYPIDTINTCNYLFYKNTGFTTKYYYCFITNMEYVNENATRITFETDVYQSYMFDIEYKKSFIEREHVNDDTIGKNTTPEGLETGEFVVNEYQDFDNYANDIMIIAGVTRPPAEIWTNISSSLPVKFYNGVYSGLYYIVFKTIVDVTKFLMVMDGQGIADAVYDVFTVPKSILPTISSWDNISCDFKLVWNDITYTGTFSFDYKMLPNSSGAQALSSANSITMNSTLNGYTPKNNKMFTGEFNYMYVTNNAGNDVKYNYEDFYNNAPIFDLMGAITPGCSIRLVPKNYKLYNQGVAENYCLNPYGLSGAKYPICSWTSDSYTNWITQQGVNILNDRLVNATSVGIMGLAGNIPIATLGVINGMKDELSLRLQRDFTPPQAKGNANTSDVTYAMGWNTIVLYKMSVRYEFAKRIDDYFSAYGYKVDEIKTPNVTGRTYWNYVKTIGCNLEGNIPQEYINKLKEMFNNGVTFWHDPTKFLDYSQNNTIVS